MRKVHLDLKENSYDILIKEGLLTESGEEISKVFSGGRVHVVTDDNVRPIYFEALKTSLNKAGFSVSHSVLEAGEHSKSFETLPKLYSELLSAGITRSDLVVALGGGVVGDITGFAAATFLRGISFVQIPTSLLAQVDSSVGGKVAADLPEGKNLVGAFLQPKLVLIDPLVLKTLPDRFYRDGMAEVIKYGCIFSEAFFSALEQDTLSDEEIIFRCCEMKARIVEEDERDLGERMLLNFGHTLGHAIETYYNFSTYTHGEAVAIGMIAITRLAEEKGLTQKGTAQRIMALLEKNHLPTALPEEVSKKEVLLAVAFDKKNMSGNLRVVLLSEVGDSFLHDTNVEFFREWR